MSATKETAIKETATQEIPTNLETIKDGERVEVTDAGD
jgi:hypothetical protein